MQDVSTILYGCTMGGSGIHHSRVPSGAPGTPTVHSATGSEGRRRLVAGKRNNMSTLK